MKLPFRWGSGSSHCGEAASAAVDHTGSDGLHHRSAKPMHNEKILTRLEGPPTKESSLVTTSKASSASYYLEEPSKPVDMDQFCEEDEDAAGKASDAVSGMEKCTISSTLPSVRTSEMEALFPAVEDEDHRMSALTKAMTMKQASLTKVIEGLFNDAFSVALMKDLPREQDEFKIAELKEKVALSLSKQGRVTKQFIDLIHRLEEEAMEKEAINRELQKRLKMANRILDSEGITAVDTSLKRRSFPSRKGSSSQRNQPNRMQPHSPTDMFAITEIFCNRDADESSDEMSCLFDETAQTPKGKEPFSPLTEKTVTTISSMAPALASENELLEF